MKEILNFVFVIDVSGSMYGKKIASVNASLTECLYELKQLGCSEEYDIKVSIVTFAEKMNFQHINEKQDNISAPHIKVEPQADGFYSVTSFGCLYNGLNDLLSNDKSDNRKISDGREGKNTFIFLFSDAKPIDNKEYNEAYEAIQSCTGFKNATKYVGYVEDNSDKFNSETLKFVDYKPDHIVRASEMSGEISKLQMAFFFDLTSELDDKKFGQLFV